MFDKDMFISYFFVKMTKISLKLLPKKNKIGKSFEEKIKEK